MSSAFILVILTALEGGQLSAAFVNTATAEDCERRGADVRSILTSQKVDIRELGCFQGAQRFEKFAHGRSAGAPRHAYRVMLSKNTAQVESISDADSCAKSAKPTNGDEGARLYCATSTQAMLPETTGG